MRWRRQIREVPSVDLNHWLIRVIHMSDVHKVKAGQQQTDIYKGDLLTWAGIPLKLLLLNFPPLLARNRWRWWVTSWRSVKPCRSLNRGVVWWRRKRQLGPPWTCASESFFLHWRPGASTVQGVYLQRFNRNSCPEARGGPAPGVSWATGPALPSHLATPLWGVAQGQEGFWGVLRFGMLWGSYCLFVLCLPPDKGAWHTTWTDNSHKSDKLVKDFHTLAGEETPRPQGCAPGPPINLQPLRHQHHHSTPSLPPSLLAPLPTGSLPSGASGKEPTYHCRLDVKDAGSISGWGRYPGEGNSNPLQYSCLENTMDKGAWRATVHRVP